VRRPPGRQIDRRGDSGHFDFDSAIGTAFESDRPSTSWIEGSFPVPLDLPMVFKHHVFCCFQQRPQGHPKGSCTEAGCKPLWERLGAKLEASKLPEVSMTAAGCLGFCRAGPLMVVYPEGIWYRPQSSEDIDEIVQSHFVEGNPVERLIIVPHL
jgi:(2Fe-2S) ferredoxin